MLGNGFFRPGQLVFVDIAGLEIDPQLAIELNLGGYFLVVEVEMNIINGKYTTDLELQWQGHYGFGKPLGMPSVVLNLYNTTPEQRVAAQLKSHAKLKETTANVLGKAAAAGNVSKGVAGGHGTKASRKGTKKAPTYTPTAGPSALQ